MDLPAELVADILSRIPIKTIVQASCVCKTWCSILSELYFIKLHLSRSPAGIILHEQSYTREDDVFKVGELNNLDQHDLHMHLVMKFVLGRSSKHYMTLLQGSVNGLICVWHCNEIYICNPTTRENIVLPDHRYFSRKSDVLRTYGFGFVQGNNQYKVICFYHFPSTERSDKGGCLVYTLGTGMWRSLGHVPFLLHIYQSGLFFAGNLHWLANDQKDSPTNEILCTFDLEKEVYQLTTSAPRVEASAPRVYGNGYEIYRSLGLLGVCLCICDNTVASELVIWVMKDYGMKESWTKEIVIRNKPTLMVYSRVHPLKVLRDGTILMVCYGSFLFTYHPSHKTVQIFYCGARIIGDAMIYVPSFIRLKDFVLEKVSVL